MLIIGLPQRFAIESAITEAYERRSQLAMGYLILHVGGRAYGVRQQDASLLACSFDAVRDRLSRRGSHVVREIQALDATTIAKYFIRSYLEGEPEGDATFGTSTLHEVFRSHTLWARDGDEAFDDGSYVFQFDVGDQVRLVAFRNDRRAAIDLSETWLSAEEFYSILSPWLAAFEDDRRRATGSEITLASRCCKQAPTRS